MNSVAVAQWTRRALRGGAVAALLCVAVACSDSEAGPDTGSPAGPGTGAQPPATVASNAEAQATPSAPMAPTAPTAPAATATVAPGSGPALFDGRGPFAVGVTTLQLEDRASEVYYPVEPADAAGAPTDVFESVSVFPEQFRSLVPDEIRATFDVGAVRDAPAATGGPFPVVVYSHGLGLYRQASAATLAHLASWGFVVATTDHLERGLLAQLTGTLGTRPDHDLEDVRDTLSALGKEHATAASVLEGAVDVERVGVIGHSAGANTAVRAASSIATVDGFVSLAGGPGVRVSGDDTGVRFATVEGLAPGDYEIEILGETDEGLWVRYLDEPGQVVPFDALTIAVGDGAITLATGDGTIPRPGIVVVSYDVPSQPGMVIFGDDDHFVTPERSEALFEDLEEPRYLVGIRDAGHNSFTDMCPEVRARGGLESLRSLAGSFVDLAQDGCGPDDVDPQLVQRVVNHYTTAFFLTHVAGSDQSATLAVDPVNNFGAVELSEFAAS